MSHVFLELVKMPPRRVNVNHVNGAVNPSEGDKTLATLVWPRMENVLDDSLKPLVKAMIRAFQRVASAKTFPASKGLSLKCIWALSGKEFNDVRGDDPTKAEYWLESVKKLLENMPCTEEEKLGCTVPFLTSKAHCWWNPVKSGAATNRLTWDFFLETFKKKFMGE